MAGFEGFATARLGAKPRIKELPNDKGTVGEMRCYVNAGYYDKTKQGWVDKGFWANVDVFGNHAEYVSKFEQGDKVTIYGTLSQDRWEGEEGERTMPRIICNYVAPYLPDLAEFSYKPRSKSSAPEENKVAQAS